MKVYSILAIVLAAQAIKITQTETDCNCVGTGISKKCRTASGEKCTPPKTVKPADTANLMLA